MATQPPAPISSAFPAPPPFYKFFTPANLSFLAAHEAEDPFSQILPPELSNLVPPLPPQDGKYRSFGIQHDVNLPPPPKPAHDTNLSGNHSSPTPSSLSKSPKPHPPHGGCCQSRTTSSLHSSPSFMPWPRSRRPTRPSGTSYMPCSKMPIASWTIIGLIRLARRWLLWWRSRWRARGRRGGEPGAWGRRSEACWRSWDEGQMGMI